MAVYFKIREKEAIGLVTLMKATTSQNQTILFTCCGANMSATQTPGFDITHAFGFTCFGMRHVFVFERVFVYCLL